MPIRTRRSGLPTFNRCGVFVARAVRFANCVHTRLGTLPRSSSKILRNGHCPNRGFAGTIRFQVHDGGIAAEVRSVYKLWRAKRPRVRFSFPHSHAFPGARVIVADDGLAEGECLVEFGDGGMVLASFRRCGGALLLKVPTYRTVRGSEVGTRQWLIELLNGENWRAREA